MVQAGTQFVPSRFSGGQRNQSVVECYANTSGGTDGPEELGYGSRSGTGLTG